ncbi:hypothetical protein CKM354_000571500 [Cercospora kikuchii]|uniref:Uncharacterized protein n=1 Tax=Cercospora kikuchii TaxID=84275 RepID=A0A9P3CML9_9PEZI|nr:uncharacterized protein CKM354_000571500 [Cercospora kikuchii]GIZ42445.1 hypothetical protein CKM354_000571500 [Cercospora kikuchii]
MPPPPTNGLSPQEISHFVTQAALAKARLNWPEYVIKSFFGGVFISLGGMIDFIVNAGSPALRASNPGLATLIAGFTFPLGFVLTSRCSALFFAILIPVWERRWGQSGNWAQDSKFHNAEA